MGTHADAVRTAFTSWEQGDSGPFFGLVSRDVTWRVIGTSPISGTYTSKKQFLGATRSLFSRLAGPVIAKVNALHCDGDTVVLEWEGTSEGINGRPYHQTYCWVMRFSGNEIVDVTAYLDTALLDDMFAD